MQMRSAGREAVPGARLKRTYKVPDGVIHPAPSVLLGHLARAGARRLWLPPWVPDVALPFVPEALFVSTLLSADAARTARAAVREEVPARVEWLCRHGWERHGRAQRRQHQGLGKREHIAKRVSQM